MITPATPFSETRTFLEALELSREPKWKNISNAIRPGDHSCDNSLLFWSTALVHIHRLMTTDPLTGARIKFPVASNDQERDLMGLIGKEIGLFSEFVRACSVEPGLYKRYPGVPEGPASHDCHTGVAVAAKIWGLPFAKDILRYAETHGWCFEPPRWNGRGWLARIPDFAGTVRICAEDRIFLGERLLWIAGVWNNSLEEPQHTSGKCLVYLKQYVVAGKYRETDLAVKRWQKAITRLYPGGMKGVYSIYFSPAHAFTLFAPTRLSIERP